MSPIEGTMAEVQQIIVGQVCAEHGEAVGCIWDARAKTAMVKCMHGEYPARLKPMTSLETNINRGEAAITPLPLSYLPTRDLGDDHALTPQERGALIAYAQKYGLDPNRNHVMVMYGRPYIGLDGYIWHARHNGIYCKLGSRPLTAQEKVLYEIDPADLAWIAEGERTDTHETGVGLGIVAAHELTDMSTKKPGNKRYPIVAAHPQLQAQKRAEWQWYRRMCPIGDEGVEQNVPPTPIVSVDTPPTSEQIAERKEQVEKDSKELF